MTKIKEQLLVALKRNVARQALWLLLYLFISSLFLLNQGGGADILFIAFLYPFGQIHIV